MGCTPISVALEVDPTTTQKILFNLDKICNQDDTVQWKLHFELQEIRPPNTTFSVVVKLDVAITKDNHPQAEATAKSNGLDESQRGAAQVAAAVAKDPNASADDKQAAVQNVIAAKEMPPLQVGGGN